MLAALLDGERDPAVLAELAKGRLRSKQAALRAALEGRVRPEHCFVLHALLTQIDNLDETITGFDAEIARACVAQAEAIRRLDGIPGIGEELAQIIVAEIGTDMSHWPSAGHLAAWAGVAPGNNESAGKRRNSRTRKGNKWLRTALMEAATSAARTKSTYFAAQYRRIAARRGRTRATMAVAHSLVVVIHGRLARGEEYQELGADYFERQAPQARAKRLARQLEKLGYTVTAPTGGVAA
jgi:transposase